MHSGAPRNPILSILGIVWLYRLLMMLKLRTTGTISVRLHTSSSPYFFPPPRLHLSITSHFCFHPPFLLTVFDGSKSPHLSFTSTHFLSSCTHTRKRKVNPSIVSCPPELLSDYAKQKRVRKWADLNRGLIFMCLSIRLLSVSYH